MSVCAVHTVRAAVGGSSAGGTGVGSASGDGRVVVAFQEWDVEDGDDTEAEEGLEGRSG